MTIINDENNEKQMKDNNNNFSNIFDGDKFSKENANRSRQWGLEEQWGEGEEPWVRSRAAGKCPIINRLNHSNAS